jgi:hypothetical protein
LEPIAESHALENVPKMFRLRAEYRYKIALPDFFDKDSSLLSARLEMRLIHASVRCPAANGSGSLSLFQAIIVGGPVF